MKLPACKAGHRREFAQEGVCNPFLAPTPLAFISVHRTGHSAGFRKKTNNFPHRRNYARNNNAVALSAFVLAYNLGNFLRRFVLPKKIKHWSLRSLLVKFIKIGAKVVRHSGYITFQMAEVTIDKSLFAEILSRIERLRCYAGNSKPFCAKQGKLSLGDDLQCDQRTYQ